ncbi:hypothetical protein REPUB_Repub14bG0066400 [Reevesia pubescens]
MAAVGVVVRDDCRNLVDGMCEVVQADSVVVVECIAVNEGLKLATDRKYSKVIVEMDSSIVYNAIKGEKRTANSVANWVVSQAIKGMCRNCWVLQPPSSLVHDLSRDDLPAPPYCF